MVPFLVVAMGVTAAPGAVAGTDVEVSGFDTKCLGGQDWITTIITNRPSGDLAFLNADYDFTLVGTGKAKGHDK